MPSTIPYCLQGTQNQSALLPVPSPFTMILGPGGLNIVRVLF
jgi:hypothetical protein